MSYQKLLQQVIGVTWKDKTKKIFVIAIISLAVLLALHNRPIRANGISWEQLAAPSGGVEELVTLDNLVFARTAEAIFKSPGESQEDCGASWSPPLSTGSDTGVLHAMDVDLEALYVASQNGVIVSTDFGDSFSWSLPWGWDDSQDIDFSNGYGWAAIDMWGSRSGPNHKTPEGDWELRRGNIPWPSMSMDWVFIDLLHPDKIAYIGGIGRFRTLDGGTTWTPIENGIIFTTILDGKSIVFSSNKFSEDYGETWMPLGIEAITLVKDDKTGYLFVGKSEGGVYQGRPGQWSPYGLSDQNIQSLAICQRWLLAVSTEGKIFRANLEPLNVFSVSPSPNALNISPATNITATFSADLNPSSVTSRTFVIHGDLSGHYTQTLSYNVANRTITLNPPGQFKPGEVVNVSASSRISSTGGISLTPYIWQFWTAAGIASGNFIPRPTTPTLPGVASSTVAALGDLDGDDDLDAIIANYADGSNPDPETVWRNDGAGNFTLVQSFGGGDSVDMALGDIDGDGDLDIVVVDAGVDSITTIWLNNGMGVFTPHPTPSFNPNGSSGVALGDIDGDGDLDAVIANAIPPTDTVWINDGAGGFTPHPTTPGFGAGYSGVPALGDMDNDGDLDAVITNGGNPGDEPDTIWLNDGAGNFTFLQNFGNSESQDVALGDLNGDGDLDVVVANGQNPGPQAETVWDNDGTGQLTLVQSLSGGDSRDVTLGDIDGDGDLDALIGNADGAETVWRNNGLGNFTQVQSFGAGHSLDVSLGDIDGDGDLDALVANHTGEAETVWLNKNNPDLTIAKTDSPDPVKAGSTLTYTIHITNTGPDSTTALIVTDTLPSGVNFIGAGGSGWSCGRTGGVITCTRPSLGVTTAPDITITVTAPSSGGIITNTALINSASTDPVRPNTATATTTVIVNKVFLPLILLN